MAGFGEHLRREREMRGISLEEISETTKISVRFLNALENEEFSKLPGGIFARSFIRSYAEYLGLDMEGVIAEFQLVAPPKDEEDFSKLGTTGNSPKQKRKIPLLPWLIAVALLGGGYAMFRYAHRSADDAFSFSNPAPDRRGASASVTEGQTADSTAGPQVLAPQPAAAPASADPSTGSPADLRKRPPPAASAPPGVSVFKPIAATATPGEPFLPGPERPENFQGPAPAAILAARASGGLVLRVTATQPSWVAVDADGKPVLESVLTPNQVRTFIARNSFDVTTGNARATTLTLNGVILQSSGRQGEVKKVHLTRAYLKRPTL